MQILAGVLLFFLSLTIGSLLCWHIYLLCHNMTTIEYREAVRAKWLAKKSGQKYRHRFDLGMRKNIQMILGPNILCWLCPTATGHLKDGTEFQITNNWRDASSALPVASYCHVDLQVSLFCYQMAHSPLSLLLARASVEIFRFPPYCNSM